MRIAGRIASAATTMMVVAAALALGAFTFAVASGLKPAVIKSGSMEPMLSRGSLILVKPTPADQLKVGDVITFGNPNTRDGNTVTHRITTIQNTEKGTVFITKGDNNDARDPWNLQLEKDAGVLRHDVPYVGHLSFFVHSKLGYGMLLIIPVLLLSFASLRSIWSRAAEPLSEPVGEGL